MEQHNKIINNAAKKILSPHGIFRKGSSRIWLDDNDYFLTVIEFQPSGYDKGSYLNVGLTFLWETTEDLNDALVFELGGRVFVNGRQFVSCKNDETFSEAMESFAAEALKKAEEYRKFRDLKYAKGTMAKNLKPKFWSVYNLAMLCFFKGDFTDGKKYFDKYLDILKNSFYNQWHENFYNYLIAEIVPKLASAETAQRMVFDMINRRREFFNGKAAFKKMKKDILF